MLDVTPYKDKLPQSLNLALREFTGGECVLVRKSKNKDVLTGSSGNCHQNVKILVENHGGSSISGWLLTRVSSLLQKGMYVWSFHSVWMQPDGKLLDVTDDVNYAGKDKSTFLPDSSRVPDLVEEISYNNFVVFVDQSYLNQHSSHIGKKLSLNTPYWSDDTLLRILDISEHPGTYRLITSNSSKNFRLMCEEYEMDIVNGKLTPRLGSKYSHGLVPARIFFDYSLKML
jgi:hypothetical protein